MQIPDVNILVNAYRADAPSHERCRNWLARAMVASEPLGLLDIVCSGFVRIVTNPRIFAEPASTAEALDFVEALRAGPASEAVGSSGQWWAQFAALSRQVGARANLVTDVHIAAIALSVGATVVTLDRDFRRFEDVPSTAPG